MLDTDYGYEDSRDYYKNQWTCNADLYELWWKWQKLFAERKKERVESDKKFTMEDVECELEDIQYLLEKYVKKTDKLLKKVSKLDKKIDNLVIDEDDYFETECPCCGAPLDVYVYEE